MDTGYCIDYEVLSLQCETCDIKKKQLTNKQFELWFKSHKSHCSKNYDGTSKGMEAEGALRIFKRSLSKGLRYKWLVCDGDSAAYNKIKNIYIDQEAADVSDINVNVEETQDNHELMVLKLDCINHVKKRVMNRLKDIKSRNTGFQDFSPDMTSALATASTRSDGKKMKTNRGSPRKGEAQQPKQAVRLKKTLADGKPFGGSVGRMTDTVMVKMSEMYGLAIRQGSDEGQGIPMTAIKTTELHEQNAFPYFCSFLFLEKGEDEEEIVARLQKKCLAAFHHLIVHEEPQDQHYYCPDGILSWCSYKRDQVTNKNEDEIKNKSRLDPVFLDLLQKMITDLTSKELLSRCIRGLTQNSNESLNSVVWSILSKSKYHGFSSIQGAAASAAVYFNGGRSSLLGFFEESGIPVNGALFQTLVARNEKRIQKAEQMVEQRQTVIFEKNKQRRESLQATYDTSEYASGLF